MGLHEIKELLHRKGNTHQTEGTTYKIFASYTSDMGLYRELKKPTLSKNQ
jgi:hypothetical protein